VLGRLTGVLMLASFGVFPVSVAPGALVVHGLGPAPFFPLAGAAVAAAILWDSASEAGGTSAPPTDQPDGRASGTANIRAKRSMPGPQTLLMGLAFGESPRWHEDRLWFSNWGTQEIVAVDLDGKSAAKSCASQAGMLRRKAMQSSVTSGC
jgi:hypothetical protein